MGKIKKSVSKNPDGDKSSPPDTEGLRAKLDEFLKLEFLVPEAKISVIGGVRWGVYAFFDYDGEPIYVGQTNEMLRTRIRRHLTNQRTDAVAMAVLDPFEVYEIEVWPLPQYQGITNKHPGYKEAQKHLNALERQIYDRAIAKSEFGAILNEKNPPPAEVSHELPASIRFCIVSEEVFKARRHADTRIARRADTISRLAKVIAERKVQVGLRRTLRTQAARLLALAERRYTSLGGEAEVAKEKTDNDKDDEDNGDS